MNTENAAAWQSSKRSSQIANALREQIIAAGFAEGAHFYSQNEIMEKWNCSRATAREALRLLEADGLLISKPGPGGGTFICRPSMEGLQRTLGLLISSKGMSHTEVMEARIEIEAACTKLAARRANAFDLQRMRELQSQFQSVDFNSSESAYHINVDFHKAVAAAAHNRLLLTLMEVLENVIYKDTKMFVYNKESRKQAIHAHDTILQAIEKHEEEVAVRRMRRHLEAFESMQSLERST